MEYEPVIGLEVHAQLQTLSKIFCGCSTQFGAEPNTQTCPVCLGMPGVLPVINQKAVEYAIRMALAVHCEIREHSIFARKHYFYPDLPKGYQISQYEEPLAERGWMEIPLENGDNKKIRIHRIHLEEDAGKSVHAEEYVGENESLVDLNRCGTPLIEIVSEPDIGSPKEAYLYLQKIRQLVRWLEVCDGNMEEGSLRCDANISMRPVGSQGLGVKTELKNMNSFRGVEKALQFEVERQREVLIGGGQVIQETRLWDEDKGIALSMRGKEEAHDYRYFPDPDLIPLNIPSSMINNIRDTLPEMPDAIRQRCIEEYRLPEYDASVLTEDRGIADYFDTVVKAGQDPKKASNWVMGEVLRVLKEEKLTIDALKIRPEGLAKLIGMVDAGTISNSTGKTVFSEAVKTGKDPDAIVKALGLTQVSDTSELESLVKKVLDDHPNEVQKYLDGKTSIIGFLVGQAMKASQGKANPQVVNKMLKDLLKGMN